MTTKQQEKSRQTMHEIMDSAMRLFGRQGYQSTSVAEITRHAGYAKGSFYRHWTSKDELFLQIVERKLAAYRSARDERIGQAANLEEALRSIWSFLQEMVADRDWAKVILEFTVHAARNPELRKKLNRTQHRLSDALFARLIHDFVPEGFPAERLGAINTALFEGFMVHNALETGTLAFEDVRETAVHLGLNMARRHAATETLTAAPGRLDTGETP